MKKFKLLAVLFICIMLGMSEKQPAHAGSDADTPITISPRYTYISSTMTSLANANGKASCTATITAHSSSSNLKVFMYLEKLSGGSWVTAGSWYKYETGSSLTVQQSVGVSSGTYRVRASYYANGENIVKYSAEKKF